jgi:hypothetical protein
MGMLEMLCCRRVTCRLGLWMSVAQVLERDTLIEVVVEDL